MIVLDRNSSVSSTHGDREDTAYNGHSCVSSHFVLPFFEHKSCVVRSRVKRVAENHKSEPPVVRMALTHLGIDRSVEIYHNGDLSARSGFSSNSSFMVGVLHAFYALLCRFIGKVELVRAATYLDQTVLHEYAGVQAQIQTPHDIFLAASSSSAKQRHSSIA